MQGYRTNPKSRSLCLILVVLSVQLATPGQGVAKKLLSEARSVIKGIETKSTSLSDELTEFHQDFSSRAAKMVQLEAIMESLIEKGYLGKHYADSPEKYERIYAEYARYMSEIKDVFVKYAPRIQRAVSNFNRSVYQGKDRIGELRSDDMAVVEVELGRIKQDFQQLKKERSDLELNCPESDRNSRTCRRAWLNYQSKLRRLKQKVARISYMKKMSDIKNSISDKLAGIIGQYVYKEADTVDMLLSYAFNFEQYADIIGSKDLGGMLRTIRELGKLESKIKDFEQFQMGLNVHVADMGTLVDERLDHFMKRSGMTDMEVESRSEVLQSYGEQEDDIEGMIQQLESEL